MHLDTHLNSLIRRFDVKGWRLCGFEDKLNEAPHISTNGFPFIVILTRPAGKMHRNALR